MTLEEQILSLWGRLGNWNHGGIDRAAELASLLRNAGVTTLNQIAVTPAQFAPIEGEFRQLDQEGPTQFVPTQPQTVFDTDAQGRPTGLTAPASWSMGGQSLGFLGNVNNDGTVGSNARADLGPAGENPLVGWSARGKGHMGYRLVRQPDGSSAIVPEWGSSSDAGDIQDAIKGAAMVGSVVAGGAGLDALLGSAAAAGAAPISTAGLGGAGAGLQQSLAGLNAAAASVPAMAPMAGAVGPGLTLAGAGMGGGTGAGLSAGMAPATSLATTGMGPATAATTGATTAGQLFDLAKTAAPYVGAIGGALTSGDKTATQTREPWAAAQPWLKDMIAQGQQLQQQYQANPFSSTQQQAYGNLFGLLNQFNTQMAPGLLNNINAMRVGGSPVGAPSMGLLNPTFKVGG